MQQLLNQCHRAPAIANALIGRGGQQPRERMSRHHIATARAHGFGQRVSRLQVATCLRQRHRVAHSGFRILGCGGECLPIFLERIVDTTRATQAGCHPQPCLCVRRPYLERGGKPFDGVRVLAVGLCHDAQAELGGEIVGRLRDGVLEFGSRSALVVHHAQRRSEAMMERGAVWRQCESSSKLLGRRRPIFFVQLADAEALECLRALEQRVQFNHQGVARCDASIPSKAKMLLRLGGLAERAVRDRQRIVGRRRLRVQAQHVFEKLDRFLVVALRQPGAPLAESCRDRLRIELQRTGKHRLGHVRFSGGQAEIAVPHQRIHIVWLQLKHPVEQSCGLRQVALRSSKLGKVVRPPVLGWIKRLVR